MESPYKPFGILLLIAGLCVAAYFFLFFDTTVATAFGDRRVHNLGLMQDRQIGLIVGVTLAVLGTALLFVARGTEGPRRQCPFCAESVRLEAKICRFCGKDLPEIAMQVAVENAPVEPPPNKCWTCRFYEGRGKMFDPSRGSCSKHQKKTNASSVCPDFTAL